jgi:hypothetical protein
LSQSFAGVGRVVISFANSFLLALLLCFSAYAEDAARITHTAGTVGIQSKDGAVRLASINTGVNAGDTVTTEKNSVVRLQFKDGAQITLRPETSYRVDSYNFDQNEPKKDGFVSSLLKGGMRAITGLVGKRGNKDAYKSDVKVATMGIRGTRYGVRLCETETVGGQAKSNCDDIFKVGKSSGIPKDGLFVEVTEGAVSVTNEGGEKLVKIGEFSYVPDLKTPAVLLPEDPGIGATLPSDLAVRPGAGGLLGFGDTASCTLK